MKPRDGEAFTSRILEIEPKDVLFSKPVTILLSHSLYEDKDFVYFYDLVVKDLSQACCQDLKAERTNIIEGIFHFEP